MTKIADIPPFCSSCYQAGPEKKYIDFEAAYDGPVLTLEDGRKQPIDDLVICEDCLSEAFNLFDHEGLKQRISELEGLVERMQADIDTKDGMIQRLGITTTELIEHPIKRQPGYIVPVGVPEEVKTYLRDRKAERIKKKRSDSQKKAIANRAAK